MEGNDVDAINAAAEKLTTAFYSVSEKLYQQASANGQTATQTTAETTENTNSNDNVVDADYNVVEDDNNNK